MKADVVRGIFPVGQAVQYLVADDKKYLCRMLNNRTDIVAGPAPSAESRCSYPGIRRHRTEPAARDGIAHSYMTRVQRLTLLAPDIVEAILDGRQGPELGLKDLLEVSSADWEHQTAVPRALS